MNWWEQPVWALDLETTGVDPMACEVVQWAIARVAPSGRVLEAHTGIVRTEAWSDGAEGIHGITREESQAGMTTEQMADQMWMQLVRVIPGSQPLVVFNAPYDLTILQRLVGNTHRLTVIDPLVLDRGCVPRRKGMGARKLGALAVAYGVPAVGAHDALGDAVTAARLAFAMAGKHAALRTFVEDLQATQAEWASEWAMGLQEYLRRTDPSAVVDGSWPVRRQEEAVS